MVQLTICVLLSSVIALSTPYTVVYKNSQQHCRGNRYSHIYNYLTENKHCFQLQWCDENHCCFHECGAYSPKAQHLSIINTELVPPNAFANSDLLHITAIQQNITRLASKSFVNLYKIEDIFLSFNKIRYIQHDVFVNVSANFLDLSWNKLVYIEQDAFEGLPNLKVLNLTHNELSYIYSFPKDSVLTDLIVSHNYLRRLVISSVRYPNLEILDASFNNLTNVAVTSRNRMELIDFTNNDLATFDLFDVENLQQLRFGHNKFAKLDVTICQNVSSISAFPNPWNCFDLLGIMVQCTTTPGIYTTIKSNSPCDEVKRQYETEQTKATNLDYCTDNSECPTDQICRTNRCSDPCLANPCDPTSVCKTENHVFKCECQKNTKRNPLEFHSACYEVECFVDEDCSDKMPCDRVNHVCDPTKSISFMKASSIVRTYPWYYDEEDPILGEKVHEQNFHRTESKGYLEKTLTEKS